MERKIQWSLIVLSVLAIFQSLLISGKELTWTSPGAFPLFISALLLLFSIWIFIEGKHGEVSRKKEKIFTKEIIFIIILIFLYGLFLETIGFEIATFGFLFLSISYLSKMNLFRNLSISLFTVIIIVFIFKTIFKVILP